MRWNSEEEKALRDGVAKYGQGKWKKILKDPNFLKFLSQRSNVDIKDKWRNMNDKVKENTDLLNEENQTPATLAYDAQERKRYKAMIREALLASTDPLGYEIDDIVKFIQQKHEVPRDFKRSLSLQLESLVSEGQLEKANDCYRIKLIEDVVTKTPSPTREGKRPKHYHSPGSEEEVGMLKQAVHSVFGRCKGAISWSPFGSISGNGQKNGL